MTGLADFFDEHDLIAIPRDAARVLGLPPTLIESWSVDPDDGQDHRDPVEVKERFTVMRAYLWWSCSTLVDKLFTDLSKIEAAAARTGRPVDPSGIAWEETLALYQLPARFRHRYDLAFLRAFTVTAVALTARFATTWEFPATVAEELAVDMLLGEMEIWADMFEYDLGDNWRDDLEEFLVEDTDHAFLYDDALDGFENDPTFGPPGMAPMDFPNWFVTFNDEYGTPAYARSLYGT